MSSGHFWKNRRQLEKIAGGHPVRPRQGLYLWGKDERPVRRGILSADNRAFLKCQMDWRTGGTEKAALAPCPARNGLPAGGFAGTGCLRDHESAAFWKISVVFTQGLRPSSYR